jgi:hypothetical protein
MAMLVLDGPTIAAGESLSNILNVTSGGIYRIMMPMVWTPAPITFQLSYNGIDFYNVADRGGAEITMACQAGAVVPIGEYLFYIHSVKIRSGGIRKPVIQEQDAMFRVVLETKQLFEAATPASTPSRDTRRASPGVLDE